MDGQSHVEWNGTEAAERDSKGAAVKIEPKDGHFEGQSTGRGYDCDYKAAAYTPLEVSQQGRVVDMNPTVEEIKPVDLPVFNIGESLFGEADVPMAMIQDGEMEVQDTGSEDDETAVYTLLELSQRGQGHYFDSTGTSAQVCEAPYPSTSQGLWPMTPASSESKPHLGAMYGPVYHQPYPAQVPLFGPSAHHHVMQSTQRRVGRPTATWTPYSATPPQAYQQGSFPAKAAAGPGPNTGPAACTSMYDCLTGGDLAEAAAVNCVGASVDSSERGKDTENGPPLRRPQKRRDTHNEKERMRRARLKNAWDALRDIVPGSSGKMNSATLCELVAEYTRHRNEVLVATYGKERADKIAQEFLQNFQPR